MIVQVLMSLEWGEGLGNESNLVNSTKQWSYDPIYTCWSAQEIELI